jgi:hypothetical protein
MNISTRAGVVILCCISYQNLLAQELPAFIEQLIAEHEAALPQRNPDQTPGQLFGDVRLQGWLGQFGTSLEAEFGIDRLTLLVTTRCGM